MIPIATPAEVREEEKRLFESGITDRLLMEKVGFSIFHEVKQYNKILIVCGTGNNAGDGYAAGFFLLEKGCDVTFLIPENRFSSCGRYYFDKCLKYSLKCIYGYQYGDLSEYDVIVDCLFGIGFREPVSEDAVNLIEAINKSGRKVISCDVPSGLAANGIAVHAVVADKVLAAGTLKYGMFLNDGKDHVKDWSVVDLGFSQGNGFLFEEKDCLPFIGKRKNNSHKGTYGYTALFGGSSNYSGAIKLAALGCSALRSGSGVVKIVVPEEIFSYVAPYMLSTTLFSESETECAVRGCSAVGVGCGWGRTPDRSLLLKRIFDNVEAPIIVDADGLYAWKALGLPKRNNLIVTPHFSEMAHITGVPIGAVIADPLQVALNFARDNECIVVLKGPSTIVTDGKKIYIVSRGCTGMATAGSGDVFLGIVTAVVGQRFDDLLGSVAYAVYLNGVAGELAQKDYSDIGMISSDTVSEIGRAIDILRKNIQTV